MGLHRLLSIRLAVPRPEELAGFYAEMGLATAGDGTAASPDGGTQVRIEEAPYRQLLGVEVGAAAERDLDDVGARAEAAGLRARRDGDEVSVVDPSSHVRFTVRVAPALQQVRTDPPTDNAPGAVVRRNRRAGGVFAAARPPRRLGHLVMGSPDPDATRAVLTDVLGFKLSDDFPGIIAFLRCSTDHHNVGIVHSPVPLLQHYSWECDDVDHVGHSATALLRKDPARQVWGFGRHHVGSNFYWYLRDPSGSFVELYSDMDVIDDDAEWEAVGRTPLGFEHVANSWGPPIPVEFIAPSDIEELQAAWAARA